MHHTVIHLHVSILPWPVTNDKVKLRKSQRSNLNSVWCIGSSGFGLVVSVRIYKKHHYRYIYYPGSQKQPNWTPCIYITLELFHFSWTMKNMIFDNVTACCQMSDEYFMEVLIMWCWPTSSCPLIHSCKYSTATTTVHQNIQLAIIDMDYIKSVKQGSTAQPRVYYICTQSFLCSLFLNDEI